MVEFERAVNLRDFQDLMVSNLRVALVYKCSVLVRYVHCAVVVLYSINTFYSCLNGLTIT